MSVVASQSPVPPERTLGDKQQKWHQMEHPDGFDNMGNIGDDTDIAATTQPSSQGYNKWHQMEHPDGFDDMGVLSCT